AVAEEAKVGQRARRQQASQQVERLGPRRRLPRPLRLARIDWKAAADGLGDRLEQRAVGIEQRVGGRLVGRVLELRPTVVETAAVGTRAVDADIAPRLFERRAPAPADLKRLG